MEFFRDPRRPHGSSRPRSSVSWLVGGSTHKPLPTAAGGCDGSQGNEAERSTLCWVCQILGPLRELDVQNGARVSPTQSFHPQQWLPGPWCREAEGPAWRSLERSPAAGRLSQSIWKRLQSSVFVLLLDRSAKPGTMPVTHSVIPEYLL